MSRHRRASDEETERESVWAEFNQVVNMAPAELERWLQSEDSRNVGWLALPSLGESYHNHHHADPRKARHGQTWREPDLTALAIWVLEKLRLARQVAW